MRRSDNWKRVLKSAGAAVLAAVFLAGCAASGGGTEVTTAAAKAGKDLSDMSWQGTVAPKSSVVILPMAAGRVTEIPVSEGQQVQAGDVLFRVDDSTAQLSLNQAKAAVEAAQVQLASAEKTQNENLSVGPAQTALDDAQNNFNRMQALYSTGDISEAAFESAKSQLEQAKTSLAAAQNGQQTGYDAAKAQADSAQAAYDLAAKQLENCTVTSPISGIVTGISIDVGQTVAQQTAALTVLDTSALETTISVADTDIDLFTEGMAMKLALQTAGTEEDGTVSEISAVSNAATGMYTVKVQLAATAPLSDIGLIADVRAAEETGGSAVYIPTKSIRSAEDGSSYVFVVNGGSAAQTPVVTGRKKNAYTEITEGLKEGDQIVMQSSEALKDGDTVRVLTVQ